jgi:hypothetical protein
MRLLVIFNIILLGSLYADTNNITYINPLYKESTQEQIEDFYFLKLSKDVLLTGRNLIDYNNFENINRVRTYTTIKINF